MKDQVVHKDVLGKEGIAHLRSSLISERDDNGDRVFTVVVDRGGNLIVSSTHLRASLILGKQCREAKRNTSR
jgi:hypothetical protein